MQPNDLALTAGWGHGGKGGVTMPGKGRLVARDYTDAERVSLTCIIQGWRRDGEEMPERLTRMTGCEMEPDMLRPLAHPSADLHHPQSYRLQRHPCHPRCHQFPA